MYSTKESTSGINLVNYITQTVYTGVDGENGLYYHDGQGTYTNADQEAGDNSYRFSRADPNNYVCFGDTEETCQSENLYRIIGVFDGKIKLIKNTNLGNNYWSGSEENQSNTWNNSTLNTEVLNNTFLSNISWSNNIANVDWKVGGAQYSQTSTPKQYFASEIETNNTIYNAKIGLMYVTDY